MVKAEVLGIVGHAGVVGVVGVVRLEYDGHAEVVKLAGDVKGVVVGIVNEVHAELLKLAGSVKGVVVGIVKEGQDEVVGIVNPPDHDEAALGAATAAMQTDSQASILASPRAMIPNSPQSRAVLGEQGPAGASGGARAKAAAA